MIAEEKDGKKYEAISTHIIWILDKVTQVLLFMRLPNKQKWWRWMCIVVVIQSSNR